MSGKLKLGVIGTGNIFKVGHAPGWSSHPEVEMAAFCDPNAAAVEQLAKDYGVQHIYRDYRDLLAREDIDIIDICTPNLYHSEISIAALNAGKHVFCEKPDAVNPVEAQKMAESAKVSGKILMVMRNNRFRPASQFLKTYIGNGHLGEVYTGRCGWLRRRGLAPLGWFTNKELSGGGPLIDLGVHFIDLSMWLMGNPHPVSVVGAAYNKFGDEHLAMSLKHNKEQEPSQSVYNVEDLATGFIRFDNGATLQIEFSWASNIEEEQTFIELRGTKGGFHFNNSQLKVFSAIEGVLCDIYPKLGEDVNSHHKNIAHFVDCVRGRTEPIITPETGVDMIRILCAIYESAATGSEIKL